MVFESIARELNYSQLPSKSIAEKQNRWFCNLPRLIPDFVSNDSPKIIWIRQKYNISLLYEIAINFSTTTTRLITYNSLFHGSIHKKNLFSNIDNILLKTIA